MASPSDVVKHRIPALDLTIGIAVIVVVLGLIIGFSWRSFNKSAKQKIRDIRESFAVDGGAASDMVTIDALSS